MPLFFSVGILVLHRALMVSTGLGTNRFTQMCRCFFFSSLNKYMAGAVHGPNRRMNQGAAGPEEEESAFAQRGFAYEHALILIAF